MQLDFGTAYLQDPRSMDEVLEALFTKFDVDSNVSVLKNFVMLPSFVRFNFTQSSFVIVCEDALDEDEAKNLLAECKVQLSDATFSELWTDADKNDDGKISLQELKIFYAKLIEEAKLVTHTVTHTLQLSCCKPLTKKL